MFAKALFPPSYFAQVYFPPVPDGVPAHVWVKFVSSIGFFGPKQG